MKSCILIPVMALFFTACKSEGQKTDTAIFKSEKLTKTATITLYGNIARVFPLFGAFEERKWTTGWNPLLIYPSAEIIEEGTTFKTHGHGHAEDEFLWHVTKFDTTKHLIQYLVSTPNRFWTITVTCVPVDENKTLAEITYSFIGLNEIGNKINMHSLEAMYKHDLKEWQDGINYYLANAKAKPH